MRTRSVSMLLAVAGTGTLLVAWALAVASGFVSRDSVPYPWEVASRIPGLVTDSEFLTGLADTIWSWFAALVLASLAAIVCGTVIGTVRRLSAPAMIVVDAFRSIPATALIPIAILLFGLGIEMKVAVAGFATFWIVLINTVYGVATVEPMRLDAARSMRWSWMRTRMLVTLPSALPSIVTGIRIASGTTLVVVLSTELLGAKSGVGTLLVQYQQALRTDIMFAGTLIVGVLGVALYSAVTHIERKALTWVYQ
ncbi:ABC transporter permease [Rhodococcus rhodochrous]|uniref:ABC transporter permease n=1 Tax=Rhodococcus TaxID=1827 RepID=UPI0007518127|nr:MULTISPECIES: ABC transporter permease subunit [Rhodococcus]MDC3724766.1 ABC transporter permease subunit [Rhodococcus sp. Rp3]MDJ0397846.1 ABC transporter permease subunit [Rhodococcus rhodochrous]MDO1483723.1 ABC transporter permease subunit [Rhodococcus rhodochrous]WSE22902.1 ABC transporter permease subunit [Rhodococcus sp. PD04]SNV08525.1 ABC transporter permease [Rhodococcus rhodochrous]